MGRRREQHRNSKDPRDYVFVVPGSELGGPGLVDLRGQQEDRKQKWFILAVTLALTLTLIMFLFIIIHF